ncbi:hypothetical protein Ancab_038563 [Ancistrocladus abbreviatus]
MSLSMAAAGIRAPSSQHWSSCLSPSIPAFSRSRYSSLPSLQFPRRNFRIGSKKSSFFSSRSRARPRILTLIQAKKQTFSYFDDLLAKSNKPVLVDFYATW